MFQREPNYYIFDLKINKIASKTCSVEIRAYYDCYFKLWRTQLEKKCIQGYQQQIKKITIAVNRWFLN